MKREAQRLSSDDTRVKPVLRAKRSNHVQHAKDLGAVAGHLTVAGLSPAEDTVAIDHEGGAVRDVTVLVVDAIVMDHTPVHIAEQRKAELSQARECLVARRAVAADREQRRPALLDRARDLIQAAQLRRSDAAEIVAIEHEDDVLSLELGERDRTSRRGRQREFGSGLTPAQRHRVTMVSHVDKLRH